MGGPESTEVSNTRPRDSFDTQSDATSADLEDIGPDGLGAKRAEIVAQHMTRAERRTILICLFIFGFAYGLENMLRVVYQPYATSGFANHSTLATVNVLRSVVAAAAYPTVARLSDVFGRLEMVIVSVAFYVLGTIIDATCKNVEGFSAGAVIYQIGSTAIILLVEVIIGDITPLKWRLSALYVPTLPFLINTWISGDVGEAVLAKNSWRVAIGMWAGLIAGASIPLLFALHRPHRRVRLEGLLDNYGSPFQKMKFRRLAVAIFWHLDVVGILLLIIIFAGILVPFTIAGSKPEHWHMAKVIAPLVLGLLCIPLWLLWEQKYAKSSLLPYKLLKDRAVWGALGVAWMLMFTYALQGNFLYTVLIVAFGESVKSATRIGSLYTFCSVLTGALLGFVVHHVRRLKPFIVAGTFLFLASFGVLFHFRGGTDSANHSGIVGAQIFIGIAGGLFPYPTQTAIQAATRHENLAVITALFLATFSIGSAFGNAVSGAIWRQTLTPALLRNLPAPYNNDVIVKGIFSDPFLYATGFPIGTPVRDAIITSYRTTQGLLTITGLCLCVPLILFSLCMRNPRLGDEQSLPNAEVYATSDEKEGRGRWRFPSLWV